MKTPSFASPSERSSFEGTALPIADEGRPTGRWISRPPNRFAQLFDPGRVIGGGRLRGDHLRQIGSASQLKPPKTLGIPDAFRRVSSGRVNAIGAAGPTPALMMFSIRYNGWRAFRCGLSSGAEYSGPKLTHAIAWLDHGLEDDGTWDAVALMNR
jgi:hypothetical protein